MDQEQLRDIDGYLKILGALCRRWTPSQRTAFLASLAERWLPTYVRFTEAENWGDADGIRQALDAVWNHLGGIPLTAPALDGHRQAIVSAAPSMDEFDSWDAMNACQLVGLAIESCVPGSKWELVTEAAGAAYTAVVEPDPGYPLDDAVNSALWQQPAVRVEIARQFRLVQQVASVPIINAMVVEALRRTNAS